MSTDYAEKEREFIAGLPEDTGRDLAAWMAAIAQSGLNERNAIIDWLRHQGFQFAKASWLERIHHNGGRLIYGSDVNLTKPAVRAPFHQTAGPPALHLERAVLPPAPALGDDMGPLLAICKGLRPLAEHLLRDIGRNADSVHIYASPPFILLASPLPFAALQPSPKMLRFFGEFGPLSSRVKPAEPAGRVAAPFAFMLLLDDARDVDEDFHRLVRAAAKR